MEQRRELWLADHFRELIVGAEVGRRERRENRRIERQLLTGGRQQLSGPVDHQGAARIALLEQLGKVLRNPLVVGFT